VVEIRKEEHHHHDEEHADAGEKPAGGDKDDDGDDHDEHAGHSEFHAQYSLICDAPANLTALETTYFTAFAGAQALNVNVVAAKGQTQMQLTRNQTTLALAGLM
jgi:ABC-type Zn2+ transport system substrate-binding protein/surface adhesin